MIEINLLPGSADRARGGRFSAADIRTMLGERLGDKYLLGAIGAAIIALGAIGLMQTSQSSRYTSLEERELRAVQDSARYTAVLTAKRKAEASRDSLFRQLAIIKSIDDSRFQWPHLLDEISDALPAYTWLTSIVQTSAPPNAAAMDTSAIKAPAGKSSESDREKARKARADSILNAASQATRFRIIGNTVDIQALTTFMKALETSPFIRNVQLTRSDLVVSEGKEVTEFMLEAESEKPPAFAIQTVPLAIGER